MTFEGDPFRTLGVAPGASLNEIKSAYRRLVKRYHPDAAGERALPRFLAIQAAYERLVDGEGHLRPGGGAAPRPGSGAGPAPNGGTRGEPWRADPGRARASRDAWRSRRSGSGGTAGYRASGGAGGSATAGGSAKAGGGAGATRSAGSSGSTGGPQRPPGAGARHHHRGPRTATPGSTSYDDAAETPLDPEWEGGAWYGPSSGTYWTLNPREYADPRKHGPEYLARARRATTGAGEGRPGPDGGVDDAPDSTAAGPDGDDPGWQWTGTGQTRTDGGAAAWRARAWTFEAADEGGTAWTPGREAREPGDIRSGRRPYAPPPPRSPAASAGPSASPGAGDFPDLEALIRRAFPENLLALARGPDRRWRLLLALVAWPPIGYALAGLVDTATGCARYSATCPKGVPLALLLVQPLIVAGLFLAPRAAAVAAFAALAALAIALPAGAILSVGALPRPVIEPTVLGVIVATTYGVAFLAAVVRLGGPPRDGDRGADPRP
jgi:hypothetical protein